MELRDSRAVRWNAPIFHRILELGFVRNNAATQASGRSQACNNAKRRNRLRRARLGGRYNIHLLAHEFIALQTPLVATLERVFRGIFLPSESQKQRIRTEACRERGA